MGQPQSRNERQMSGEEILRCFSETARYVPIFGGLVPAATYAVAAVKTEVRSDPEKDKDEDSEEIEASIPSSRRRRLSGSGNPGSDPGITGSPDDPQDKGDIVLPFPRKHSPRQTAFSQKFGAENTDNESCTPKTSTKVGIKPSSKTGTRKT